MKVSVIIPIYNVETYIERCVRSLFRQTLLDVEFIFIDDCTSDQSITVLNRLIDEYHERISLMQWQVRIERMPQNSGQAAVRRYGMQIAIGDYIAFCDSDDWMEEDMLTEMWQKAIGENCDVVVCDFNETDGVNVKRHYGVSPLTKMPFFKQLLLLKSVWSLCNKLFKRALYTDHQILYPSDGMNMGEDMVLTIEMVYYSQKVGYINMSLYNYYQNPISITHQQADEAFIRHQNQWVNNFATLDDFLRLNNEKSWNDELTYLKYKVKMKMIDSVIYAKYPKMWLDIFPGLSFRVLVNPYLGMRSKMTYYKKSAIGAFRALRCRHQND